MLNKVLANKTAMAGSLLAALVVLAALVFTAQMLKRSDTSVIQTVSASIRFVEPETDESIGTFVDLWGTGVAESEFAQAILGDAEVYEGTYVVVGEEGPYLERGTYSGEFVYLPEIPLSLELQEYTFQRCQEMGLEYELVLAIMWRESRFDTGARHLNNNGTYDNGVMQINDVNRSWLLRDYGIDNLMDPYQNIMAGTVMLSKFMEKYEPTQALMAYQYGEAGMLEKQRQGVTTNRLVNLALEKRDYYKAQIERI